MLATHTVLNVSVGSTDIVTRSISRSVFRSRCGPSVGSFCSCTTLGRGMVGSKGLALAGFHVVLYFGIRRGWVVNDRDKFIGSGRHRNWRRAHIRLTIATSSTCYQLCARKVGNI